MSKDIKSKIIFIFASWSVYDQIAKRRLKDFIAKGSFSDIKIIDVNEPQEVLAYDANNQGPVTPVAIVTIENETKIYRGKEVEDLF